MGLRTSVSAQFYLRRILIKIHRDLFKIDRRVHYERIKVEPLSTFEVMVFILEDRRFFHHHGVDVVSCFREIYRALTLKRYGGASTIDMQFVRTATGYRERTLRRKLYEMFLAWLIQYRYNKYEILRSYLSCAFFGSHIYGVERAFKQLYSKRYLWDELDFDEAAELAAMLVYPRPRSPTAEWTRKLSRRADYAKRRYSGFEKGFHKLPSPELL